MHRVLTAILARVAIPQQCLCYLFRAEGGREQVLLGIKRQGFGAGKVMGLGGHVDPGETVAEAAAREVLEESGLTVVAADLVESALITFRFPSRPEWDAVVTAYRARSWTGDLTESDELTPMWYPVEQVPLNEMWDDERYWLPQVLAGERLSAEIIYGPDCATVQSASVTPLVTTDEAPATSAP